MQEEVNSIVCSCRCGVEIPEDFLPLHVIQEEKRTARHRVSTKELYVSEVSLGRQKRSFSLVLHHSWLRLSRLKPGCFLMLSHCVKQSNEALAGLRCFGMVCSKQRRPASASLLCFTQWDS